MATKGVINIFRISTISFLKSAVIKTITYFRLFQPYFRRQKNGFVKTKCYYIRTFRNFVRYPQFKKKVLGNTKKTYNYNYYTR